MIMFPVWVFKCPLGGSSEAEIFSTLKKKLMQEMTNGRFKSCLNGFKVFFWVGNGIIDYIYTSTTSKVTAVGLRSDCGLRFLNA